MIEVKHMACCGAKEINHLREYPDPRGALMAAIAESQRQHPSKTTMIWAAYVIFSSLERSSYGKKLAKYIVENELGEVVTSKKAKRNPNTSNQIQVWMWTVDHKALRKWSDKQKVPFKKVIPLITENNNDDWDDGF